MEIATLGQQSYNVVIDLGDEVRFVIRVNTNSGYLYEQAQMFGNDTIIKLNELFKDKNISDEAITDYVYFLRQKTQQVMITESEQTINDVEKKEEDKKRKGKKKEIPPSVIFTQDLMIDCLTIYDRTGDSNYFAYLVGNLHKFWTLLSSILTDDYVSNDLKREIYLHLPYQVLPRRYINNKSFMEQWKKLNSGQEFTLNANEKFTYLDQGESVDITYHGRHEDDDKFLATIEQTITNDVVTESCYKGKRQGQQKEVNTKCIFIHNKQFGPMSVTNDNDRITITGYYSSGHLEGMMRNFFDDGKISHEICYHEGYLHGTSREWNYNPEDPISYIVSEYKQHVIIVETCYYHNGTHVVMNYNENKNFDLAEVTMYNSNKLLWKIVYGVEVIKYYYDFEGKNVINQEVKPANWQYFISDQTEGVDDMPDLIDEDHVDEEDMQIEDID